jgi:hypothetical protein
LTGLILIGLQAAFPEYMYGLIAVARQIITVRCQGMVARYLKEETNNKYKHQEFHYFVFNGILVVVWGPA